MKKQLFHTAAALSLFLMLGVAASAQTTRVMTVTIPFDFYVGNTALPAGTYTVYGTSTYGGGGFLLGDADRQVKLVFNTQQAQTAESRTNHRLEFRRYEDKYFLASIWAAGNKIGRELQLTRFERGLAKEVTRHLAQKGGGPEVVTVSIR